jgi:1,4-dihydroxy-2-naphthoate octaprenyltransferase
MQSWILATRPKTLTASLVPILVASALAKSMGQVHGWWISACALCCAFFIQIATNLFNDAIDFKKGADTEKRIGPQRVTQSGLLSPRQVMAAAYFCLGVAALSGIPLVLTGGWPIVGLGLVCLFLAYGYTGGPFPLAYRGLGDLFVLLFFGLAAVGGVYFLQTGRIDADSWVASIQIGLLATVLIAINNLRDREGDRLVGKRTLAVRLGVKLARWEIVLLCFLPFLLNLYWLRWNWLWVTLLPLLSLPLAWKICGAILSKPVDAAPGTEYNRYLAQAAGLHLVFGVLWSLGCLLQ